eukprot:753041-Hanusia_phi.AAC.1
MSPRELCAYELEQRLVVRPLDQQSSLVAVDADGDEDAVHEDANGRYGAEIVKKSCAACLVDKDREDLIAEDGLNDRRAAAVHRLELDEACSEEHVRSNREGVDE